MWLKVYYWLKWQLYKQFVGKEALEVILQSSLHPKVVLELGGASIGKNVRIHRYMVVHGARGSFKNLSIGDDVFMGKSITLDLTDKVTIEDRCGIGMNVTFITHSNWGDSRLSQLEPATTAPVHIKHDSLVNWGCIVNKGTVVEDNVIVLPGAVIAGKLARCTKVGGNPARIIQRIEID